MQLSVTLLPLIQPQSPNQTGCVFSFIRSAGLRGEVGNVSSAGGIFSSYGKHSAEMPQRLMEALIVDGGTRLLKTAAACSCTVALYSSLPPSPVLPIHCSVCFLFENSPEKICPAPFYSVFRPGKQEGRLELSCPEGSGLFQLPGWRLQEAVDRWPEALPNAHRTLGTARF